MGEGDSYRQRRTGQLSPPESDDGPVPSSSDRDGSSLSGKLGRSTINILVVLGIVVILILTTCVSMLHGCWPSNGVSGTGFI